MGIDLEPPQVRPGQQSSRRSPRCRRAIRARRRDQRVAHRAVDRQGAAAIRSRHDLGPEADLRAPRSPLESGHPVDRTARRVVSAQVAPLRDGAPVKAREAEVGRPSRQALWSVVCRRDGAKPGEDRDPGGAEVRRSSVPWLVGGGPRPRRRSRPPRQALEGRDAVRAGRRRGGIPPRPRRPIEGQPDDGGRPAGDHPLSRTG